jgi:hypothetical protein
MQLTVLLIQEKEDNQLKTTLQSVQRDPKEILILLNNQEVNVQLEYKTRLEMKREAIDQHRRNQRIVTVQHEFNLLQVAKTEVAELLHPVIQNDLLEHNRIQ